MSLTNPLGSLACHACGSGDLVTAPKYADFCRVTSDCKPWPAGGVLAKCGHCGLVQAAVTSRWEQEAAEIYRQYTIYHQSGGAEQNVFDRRTGAPSPRSARLVQALQKAVALPPAGRLLDIGCGNGAFLSAWSRLVGGWTLCGSEVSGSHRAVVEAIPGVEGLFTCPVEEIPGEFDVISMVHVLEHIPAPTAFLERIRRKLRPGGRLFVEVPDCEQNVFMLLVADHCSHFSPTLLAAVVQGAGFEVMQSGSGWVAKEVSLVSRKANSACKFVGADAVAYSSSRVFAGWERLSSVVRKVEPLVSRPAFGLFGTAIAATWLDAQTQRRAEFFVDEDPNRIGKSHLGRPILGPDALPRNATVFVALPPPLADEVAARLRRLDPQAEVVTPD